MRRLAMAYAQRVDGKRGTRYRGFYKDADGRYKSAGTYDTETRALEISQAAEKRAAQLISGAIGAWTRSPARRGGPRSPAVAA
jgi:hypothetical protein